MTLLFAAAALSFAVSSGWAQKSDRPVVVELFTSQGCYSCPPAEKFLGELVQRDDILALEFHVDYWDYIGWEDPFASQAYTARQKDYQRSLHARYVYTPQMVIDGAEHVVGSDRSKAERAIQKAAARQADGPDLSLSLMLDGPESLRVEISGVTGGDAYDVILVTYDYAHETAVKRGENRGKTLMNHHVVREMRSLGRLSGSYDKTVPVTRFSSSGGHAVLVQTSNGGPIVQAGYVGWEAETASAAQ